MLKVVDFKKKDEETEPEFDLGKFCNDLSESNIDSIIAVGWAGDDLIVKSSKLSNGEILVFAEYLKRLAMGDFELE